jgi:hypothetical protein
MAHNWESLIVLWTCCLTSLSSGVTLSVSFYLLNYQRIFIKFGYRGRSILFCVDWSVFRKTERRTLKKHEFILPHALFDSAYYYSLEPDRSWEATSRLATQERPNILRTRRLIAGNQMNLLHTTSSYSSKTHLILCFHLRLGHPSGHLSSGFPIKSPYEFLLFSRACYLLCPSYPLWLYHCNFIWRRIQVSGSPHFKVLSSLLLFYLF